MGFSILGVIIIDMFILGTIILDVSIVDDIKMGVPIVGTLLWDACSRLTHGELANVVGEFTRGFG
jgi:hypothetical protein